MSFDQLSSMESQPTTMRRNEDPEYRDDPEFDKFTEDLSNQLFTLTANIAKLSQQINLLGTKRDTPRARERVHDLLEETRDGFKETAEKIKTLNAWENVNASQKYTQQKLAREFGASGTEFQSLQRVAAEKQRQSASGARSAIESGDTSQLPSYSDDAPGSQQQQQQEQLRLAPQDEVDFQESLIIERESEIRNIEQSVGELNELFRDVAHIVREQGEQMDVIEANVDNTVRDTRGADVELRQANKYQKAARGRMCCLLLIMLVILVVIILAASLG